MQDYFREDYVRAEHPGDEHWLRYLGGALDAAAYYRIRRHIVACPDCGYFFSSMTAVRAALLEESGRLRNAIFVSDEDLGAMLERCLGELRNELNPRRSGWTSREAMFMLRQCGHSRGGYPIATRYTPDLWITGILSRPDQRFIAAYGFALYFWLKILADHAPDSSMRLACLMMSWSSALSIVRHAFEFTTRAAG